MRSLINLLRSPERLDELVYRRRPTPFNMPMFQPANYDERGSYAAPNIGDFGQYYRGPAPGGPVQGAVQNYGGQPQGRPVQPVQGSQNYGVAGQPSPGDPRGMIPVIRAAAIKYGHDPDVAVSVARKEGLGQYTGDHGKSFGSFQLYTGGGIGNAYQKAFPDRDITNPINEPHMIDYTMSRLGSDTWSPYHGAASAGIGSRQGIGVNQPQPDSVSGSGQPQTLASSIVSSPPPSQDAMNQLKGLVGQPPRVINQYMKANGIDYDSSNGKYCMALANAYQHSIGAPGTGSLLATSALQYGNKVDPSQTRAGDLGVVTYGHQTGQGGHAVTITGPSRVNPQTGVLEVPVTSSHGVGSSSNSPASEYRPVSGMEIHRWVADQNNPQITQLKTPPGQPEQLKPQTAQNTPPPTPTQTPANAQASNAQTSANGQMVAVHTGYRDDSKDHPQLAQAGNTPPPQIPSTPPVPAPPVIPPAQSAQPSPPDTRPPGSSQIANGQSVFPPGTKFNSKGGAYADTPTAVIPQVNQSMAAIKANGGLGYSSDDETPVTSSAIIAIRPGHVRLSENQRRTMIGFLRPYK